MGIAPVRMTRSGRWASIHGPGRTSWSARLTTRDRSCGPVRRPDSGSARIGKPVASARPASAAGSSGSSSGPATMRPRGVRPSSAASSATSSSSRTGRPAMAEVNGVETVDAGRPPSSASSGASGSSGSRNGTLSCTDAGGPGRGRRDRATRDRADVRLGRGIAVEQRQLRVPLRRPAVDPLLVDRLGRAAVAQLGWPVRAEHDQRHPRLLGLDHGRVELGDGGPRRGQQDDRPAARAGHAEREEAGGALVEEHPDPEPGRRPQRQGERRRARPGADDGVGHPRRDELGGERAQEPGVAHRVVLRDPERGDDRLQLDPRLLPLEVRVGVGDDPAAGEQRRPGPVDDPAPERDAQLAVAVRAEPADRARVPAAVEALVLVDERQRDVARVAADRRRRVEALPEREQARAPRGRVPVISVTRCWTKRSVMTPGSGAIVERVGDRREQVADRVDDDQRAPRGPSRTRAAAGRARASSAGVRAAPDRARDGDRPERRGPRSGRGARAWRRGTSARRAGTRTSCSRARSRRGGAARSARRARPATGGPPGGRARPCRSGRGRRRPAYIPTSRRHSSWVGCSSLIRERREHRHRDDPVRVRPAAPGPGRRAAPSARRGARASSAAAVDERRGHERAARRDGEQQLREDERARRRTGPTRRPRRARGR